MYIFLAFDGREGALTWLLLAGCDVALRSHDQVNTHECSDGLLSDDVLAISKFAYETRDVLSKISTRQVDLRGRLRLALFRFS